MREFLYGGCVISYSIRWLKSEKKGGIFFLSDVREQTLSVVIGEAEMTGTLPSLDEKDSTSRISCRGGVSRRFI